MHACHVVLRLCHRHAVLDAADDTHPAAAGRPRRRREADRGPDVHRLVENRKARRHDSDDEIGAAVEHDVAVHDRGIGAEAPAPEPIADRDHRHARRVLLRREVAAERRPDAEHAEERAGDELHRQLRGVARARERRPERHRDGGEFREGLIQLAPVNEIAGRNDIFFLVAREVVLPHHGQAIGIGVRKRPQQERVDHAEDGGVRADAERQGGDATKLNPESGAAGAPHSGSPDDVAHESSSRDLIRRWHPAPRRLVCGHRPRILQQFRQRGDGALVAEGAERPGGCLRTPGGNQRARR